MTRPAPESGCARCHSLDDRKLYAVVGSRSYCSDCWHDVGSPWPRNAPTIEQLHAAEAATRERMLKRGGEYLHLVRNGLT